MCVKDIRREVDRVRRLVGGYKLLHAGLDGRRTGVRVIVLKEISKSVVRVERWDGWIVMAWVVIQRQTVCAMPEYGPQTGRTGAEKEEFRDTLERIMGMVEVDVMLCIVVDFNAHVGVAEPGERNVLVNLVGERGIESVESLWSWEQGMGWP